MRPLPRLLALTDERVAALPDLGVRAAAIAAAGSSVALVARLPNGTAEALSLMAIRFRALANPPMAQMFVTGRSDVARATNSNGVILRRADLRPGDVRAFVGERSIIASVHSEAEAQQALNNGADGLLLGTIWPTASHVGGTVGGVGMLERVATLGAPVWAIGGVTPARVRQARNAGAWGVASISAAWDAVDPYAAAMELTSAWSNA